MSVDTLLRELADPAAHTASGRLITLSGLSDDERDRVAAAWLGLPLERRREVLQRLVDLTEDNPELDFDAVFQVALDDPDAPARRTAIEGLWEHDGRDIIPTLTRLLRLDADPLVRAASATALGRFVLMGEFGDVRPRDLQDVTDALRAVVEDVAETSEVRGRALEAVGASSQPWARDLIHDAYDTGDERMTVAALQAMGRSADSYWLPTLLQELQNSSPEMRYEAAGALGELEDEEAVPYLVELMDDEDTEVQEAVIQALGNIGGEESVEALRARLQQPDERMREAVEAALEQAEFGNDPLGLRP